MPDRNHTLSPFLGAVSEQLGGLAGAGPALSPPELDRLLTDAAAGRIADPLRRDSVVSSFFANLDLLPPAGDPRAEVVLRLVRRANEDSRTG